MASRKAFILRLQAGHENHAGDAEPEYRLSNSRAERADIDQLQVLLAVTFINFVETTLFVLLATKDLDHTIAADDLFRNLRDFAD